MKVRCILVSIGFLFASQDFAIAQDPRINWMLAQAACFEKAAKTQLTPLPMQHFYLQQANLIRQNAYFLSMQNSCGYNGYVAGPDPTLGTTPVTDRSKKEYHETESHDEKRQNNSEREKRHQAELRLAKAEAAASAAAAERDKLDQEKEKRHQAELRALKAEETAERERLDREKEKRHNDELRAAKAEAERERENRHAAELRAVRAEVTQEKDDTASMELTGNLFWDSWNRLPVGLKLVFGLFTFMIVFSLVICLPLWVGKPIVKAMFEIPVVSNYQDI